MLCVTTLVMTLLFVEAAVEARAAVEGVEARGKSKLTRTVVRGRIGINIFQLILYL